MKNIKYLIGIVLFIFCIQDCYSDTKPANYNKNFVKTKGTNHKFNMDLITKKLKQKYINQTKGLKFEKTSECLDIEGTDDCILYLEYHHYYFGEEIHQEYGLSLILAVINKNTNEIKNSFFHKNIADSDAIYISGIELDTSLYKQNLLNLYISHTATSRVKPYTSRALYIYQIKEKTFIPILENLILDQLIGENDGGCNGYDAEEIFEMKKIKNFKFKDPIVFTYNYRFTEYFCKKPEKESILKLDDLKLIYKNGEYRTLNEKIPILYFEFFDENKKEDLKPENIIKKLNARKWKKNKTFDDIECILMLKKYIKQPIIDITLKYYGQETLKIDWDKNFGYVLWNGDFVLVNETSDIKEDKSIFNISTSINKISTLNLHIKTSNIYEPRESVKLKLGQELKSTLDFSKLPISIEENLISEKNTVLKLYYRYKDKNGTEILEPISNKLFLDKNSPPSPSSSLGTKKKF